MQNISCNQRCAEILSPKQVDFSDLLADPIVTIQSKFKEITELRKLQLKTRIRFIMKIRSILMKC
jgi:hypothetical protein